MTTTNIILKGLDSISKKTIDIRNMYLPTQSYKYCSRKFIGQKVDKTILEIIDQAPIVGRHKFTLIDVKVHNLKKGQTPALPHWHFDCVKDPRDKEPEEVHHLYITEGCSTEFLEKETAFDLPPAFNFSIFDSLKGKKIEPYYMYTYGRHLHRATPADKDCQRLLIRISETNKIGPLNQIFKETYR